MPEDLGDRTLYLGASDLPHLFGPPLPRYYCVRKLFLQKLGVPPDYPRETTGAMELGHVFEPHIVAKFVERMRIRQAHIWEPGTPDRAEGIPPYFQAHLDRIYWRKDKRLAPLECKSFGLYAWERMLWDDGIPKPFIYQLQGQMWWSGLETATWACMCRDTGEFLTFDVDRNETIVRAIKKAASDFWARVEHARCHEYQPVTSREAAPVGWSDRHNDDNAPCGGCEWRFECLRGKRAAEAEELAALRKARGDLPAIEDARLSRILARLDALAPAKEKIKRIERREKCLKAAAKDRCAFLGHERGVFVDGRKVGISHSVRTNFDAAGAKADGLALDKYHSQGKVSRRLTVGDAK